MTSPTVRDAISVASAYVHKPSDPFLNRKFADLVKFRQFVWAYIRATDPVKWSYPRLAALGGGDFDHSTVIYGVRKAHADWGEELFKKLAERKATGHRVPEVVS